MKVTVNYELAEKIIDIVNEKTYLDRVAYEKKMKEIESLDGMKKMLDYYKNTFDFDTYKEILYKSLNELEYETEDETLKMIHVNLKRIMDDTSRLNNKLRLIQDYDFKRLEKQLLDKLPENTDIEVDIFFAFDALNGGTIIDGKTMMLNTMFWPSKDDYLGLVEGILLHEYHHIGLRYWVDKQEDSLEKYNDGIGMAKFLMVSIMGEGAATYFYNDGDDLYPLALESHGEEMAAAIRESMSDRGSNISKYIEGLETDLGLMITHEGDLSEIKKLRNKYTFSTNSEPLDKSIGYHMCSVIDENLGLSKLIECFDTPTIFMRRYNEAIGEDGELRFSTKLVELLQ